MDEVKIEAVCSGCLCTDRKCSPVNFPQLFRLILDNHRYNNEATDVKHMLCWECQALLKRLHTFQLQVKKAQIALQTVAISTNCLSLSNLKRNTKVDSYDLILNEDDYLPIQTTLPLKPLGFNNEEFDDIKNAEIKIENDYSLLEDNISYAESEIDIKDDILQKAIQSIKVGRPINKKTSYVKYKLKYLKENELKNYKEYFRTSVLTEEGLKDVLKKEREDQYFCKMLNKCVDCLRIFLNKKQLGLHLEVHDLNIQCGTCHIYFETEIDLQKHKSTHNIVFKCIICDLALRNEDVLKKHLQKTHARYYQCRECHLLYPGKSSCYKHYRQMHSEYFCDECGCRFKSKAGISKHVWKHLPAVCKYCELNCKNYHLLQRHIHSSHEVMLNSTNKRVLEAAFCVECNRQFSSKSKYSAHLKTSVKHVKPKKECVPCPVCAKTFSRKVYMKNHFNLVHSVSKHYCDICDKHFVSAFTVRQHKKLVHEKVQRPKTKTCDTCGRSFSTNRILANHIRTHTGERPYACPHCPAKFTQSYAMQTHVKAIHMKRGLL